MTTRRIARVAEPRAMPPGTRDGRVLGALVAVGAASLAYSLLIAQQILAWFFFAGALAALYLFWRLVRALERIAAAMETRERDR